MTQREKNRAIKRVQRAIDALVELQDFGFGCENVARSLEMMNHLEHDIESRPITNRRLEAAHAAT